MTRKLPKFKSEAQEAKFWDSHDSTDYTDELEDDPQTVFIRPEAGMIELRGELWERIVRLAWRRKTTPNRLVERWLREKLKAS